MKSNLVYPDYDHSLLSISSSILKHYGINLGYKTIDLLDKELQNGPRNVVFILVDALGSEILKKHREKSEFLINHQKDVLTTIFPSTTTAATTSALTGLPPVKTAWVGWQQFVKEEKRHVVFFQNKDYYDDSFEFSYNVSDKFVKTTTIYDLIEKHNKDVSVHEIFPQFKQEQHKVFKDQVDTCLDIMNDNKKHFVYMYWDQVDSKLHDFGTKSKEVNDEIDQVNQAINHLFNSVDDDTLIVLTADHGQIDIEPVPILEFNEIAEMLEEKPAIEARATAFYVKDEYMDKFPEVFNHFFRDKFVLYNSNDLIEMNLFGMGKPHPKFREYLGDYFSIAIDKYAFHLSDRPAHKATHAGLTKDEMLIPLIMNR
ncbi:alkaline phosphatase family protein [Mycoplasmatota bacterium]|nr:alkaline phosphatase family protein [Mycoplasmatota bacterium]